MTIPNDPQKRCWIEVSQDNPKLVQSLRPTLVSFLAFDKSRKPGLAGTGFLLAASSDAAIVITAKHVLNEGVLKIQRPVPRHHPSTLFLPDSSSTPILSNTMIKAVWMNNQAAELLNISHVFYADSLDIATCVALPQESRKIDNLSIPMSTEIPAPNETVYLVSLGGMEVEEIPYGNEPDPQTLAIKIARAVRIRVGIVKEIFPNGLRQYKWPCFTTSIPAEPGMSGGFVTIPSPNSTIAACGVVCADNSDDRSRNNMNYSGESVIACMWPALGLRVPDSLPSTEDTPLLTLYEMMRQNRLPIAIGGIDQFQQIDLGQEGSRIEKKQ